MTENLRELGKINKSGVTIKGEIFQANSGFSYASGFRNFGSLKIVEDIAGGTAVAYLFGIKVFDENGTLIIDRKMAKGFHFEREAVRRIVLNELLEMLSEVYDGNQKFDKEEAKKKIDKHLKLAYYESSYSAITS